MSKIIVKETIRAKEVSSRYSIGLSTVWKLAKDGKITPIKISQRITLFSVAELDKFFQIEIA